VPTRNINLTEHFDRFVERQVSSGRYSNASEIVRDALRLLEEQQQERAAKLKAGRQAAPSRAPVHHGATKATKTRRTIKKKRSS